MRDAQANTCFPMVPFCKGWICVSAGCFWVSTPIDHFQKLQHVTFVSQVELTNIVDRIFSLKCLFIYIFKHNCTRCTATALLILP